MANTTPLDRSWKGLGWADGTPVTAVTQPDGSRAEAVAALGSYYWNGTAWVKVDYSTLKTASFSLSVTGTVVNAVVGRRIKVFAVKLVVSAAASVNFRDGTASNLEGAQPYAANAGYVETVTPPAFLFATS